MAAPPSDPQVAQWFAAIDTDRSGFLDAQEVMKALALGGLQFSLTEVDAMFRAFDDTNTRRLGVQQFGNLHMFLMSCNQSFYAADVQRKGTLTQQQLDQALRQTGFVLDPPALAALFRKHDPDNSGTLNMVEFIRTCLGLRTASRTFQAFDVQRRGRIDLDFSQFVYACSHVA